MHEKLGNRLATQTSPYLLQHAHNPVHWQPWDEQALQEARLTQRPIFLSVGYATCYWCHVMERQVFEDAAIAGPLNERFVCIKVDREERPDVDDLYMAAVQLMTGQGGWPMNLFLTPPGAGGADDPGLKPFFAGTYIPPRAMYGRMGFPTLVERLHEAWVQERAAVLDQAEQVAQAVREHVATPPSGDAPSADLPVQVARQLLRSYDAEHGGFGQAPKFPQASMLALLAAAGDTAGDAAVLQALDHTLEAMARGGMYDQVGGGFHRYSTDERWLVPHFEKMLYDQAQLVPLYLRRGMLRVAEETCDYVLREMVDATGAFWSAQDAEVDAREGLSYLWTPREVREAVREAGEAGEVAVKLYGLDGPANFRDPHHPDEPRRWVLYLPRAVEAVTDGATRRRINALMLAVRNRRKQPTTDDKVLCAWNGMMIVALAQAGQALRRRDYTQAAQRAAAALMTHLDDGRGGLLRTMRHGVASVPGYLEDYAHLAAGLLALGEVEQAVKLTHAAVERFAAPDGGYFDTLDGQAGGQAGGNSGGQADLWVRLANRYDGATPSGNAVMVHNLITLTEMTGERLWLDRAVRDLHAAGETLRSHRAARVHLLHALHRAARHAPDAFPASTPAREVIALHVAPREVDLSQGPAHLEVTLTLAPGYHVNAHEGLSPGGAQGLVPTSIELIGGEGLRMEVEYPPARRVRYPLADDELPVYTGQVRFRVTLTPTQARPTPPRLVMHVQVCTQQSCLRARTVELPVIWGPRA